MYFQGFLPLAFTDPSDNHKAAVLVLVCPGYVISPSSLHIWRVFPYPPPGEPPDGRPVTPHGWLNIQEWILNPLPHEKVSAVALNVPEIRDVGDISGRLICECGDDFVWQVRAKEAPIETAKFLGHGVCDQMTRSSTLATAVADQDIIARWTLFRFYRFQLMIPSACFKQ